MEGPDAGAVRMSEVVIARIPPSPARRALAAGILGLLAALTLYAGLFRPEGEAVWRIVLILIGTGAAMLTLSLWQVTGRALELTETELREGGADGRVLADVSEIVSVDRGLFAFKPSNGFSARLTSSQPRVWAPGLWWRSGRRLGVGGVLRGAETRAMADALSAMIAERDRG